jgi:spoIIIJ-associated protein
MRLRREVSCFCMEASALAAFITEFTNALGVEVTSVTSAGTSRTVITIESPQSRDLIGQGGETLRALNHLLKRLAEKRFKDEELNFTVDVAGYLEKQLDVLRGNARMLAQRARLFKHDIEMPPMSAYERLVVHELFADDPEIKTESAGEGKFRHIVLKYTEKAAQS